MEMIKHICGLPIISWQRCFDLQFSPAFPIIISHLLLRIQPSYDCVAPWNFISTLFFL